jgi:hypothetical protein
MTTYEFQILAETEKQAQQFVDAVKAKDVVIENWNGIHKTSTLKEFYGFGQTNFSPERLLQIANDFGVDLVYVNDHNKMNQENDQLVQQILQAY